MLQLQRLGKRAVGLGAVLAVLGLFGLRGASRSQEVAVTGEVPVTEPMLEAARGFVDGLAEAERARAVQAFEGEGRFDWSYLPGTRTGLRLDEMTPQQRGAAEALMKSVLSEGGYGKSMGVIRLESILGEIEGNPGRRDPGRYTFTVFGMPSAGQPWGWRVEGHHLSLNFTSVTGRLESVTPAFFGANPARVPDGPRAGWRLLQAEEDVGRQLLEALDGAQRAKAVIAGRAPRDILTGMSRKASLASLEGLTAAEMSPAQTEVLLRLLDVYVQSMRPDVARVQLQKIRAGGIQQLRFAWAGGVQRGEGHYYRIQGPTVLVEYDNTQNDANHIHSVWRDLQNDFGDDALQRHYEDHPH